MNLRCIIVDDEPLAREGLARLVKEAGFLDLVAECGSAMEANQVLAARPVDLMFLDIQMPRLSGLDFLRSLSQKPQVIVTTAYADYALEGFALQVLDYLLKPVTPERFLQAVNRARATTAEVTYFFIKANNGFEKIYFDELLYIEAAQNYCALHTRRGKFLTLSTIHALEERLPPQRFIRVQKSYIVSIEKITSVSLTEVALGEHKVPVSKSYREALLTHVDQNLLRK